uniref:Uncharacterized protein n=1 Tax=Laticauda laticaudata TaxID=8630 RepID=A0A8C5RLS3_LATLA
PLPQVSLCSQWVLCEGNKYDTKSGTLLWKSAKQCLKEGHCRGLLISMFECRRSHTLLTIRGKK